MSASVQLDINFANPINPWAESEAREHLNWTPEALCAQWASGGDLEGFKNLLPYERRAWLARYEIEREEADRTHRPMRKPAVILAIENERYAQNKALAEHWAADLRQAFLKGQACPIKPAPGWEWLLEWAFLIAQVNPRILQ